MLTRFLAALTLVLIILPASADTTIGVHIGSWHSQPGYNNTNPGLYVKTDTGLVVGGYRNSMPDTPYYAGYLYTAYVAKAWSHTTSFGDVSATLGLAHGYKIAPVIPMVSVSARVGNVRISVLPCLHGSIVVHGSLEF